MWRLSRICIYPIKSLDGCNVERAEMLPSGALAGDRRYALRDAQGNWINGKTTAALHLFRARFNPAQTEVEITGPDQAGHATFRLPEDQTRLAAWFGEQLGTRTLVVENPAGGFPDDTDSPGPTIVSRQSLEEITHWFAGTSLGEIRERFRANLEIEGDVPFCEDRLIADLDHVVRFSINDLILEGTTACQRCVVPTRHPRTGEVFPHFAKHFAEQRAATRPAWGSSERFSHFYRLTVNTRVSPLSTRGGAIQLGDEVRVLDVAPF